MTNNVKTEMTMDALMEILMNNMFFFQVMEKGGDDWIRRILVKVRRAEKEASRCKTVGESVLVLATAYEELYEDSSRLNDVYLGYELLEAIPFQETFPERDLSGLRVNGEEVYQYFTLSKLGKEFLENPPYRLTVQMTGENYTDWLSAQILRLIKDYKKDSSEDDAEQVIDATMLIDRIQRIVESREKPSQRL